MRVNLSPAVAQHLLRHPLRLLHRFGDGHGGRRRGRDEAPVSDAALGAVGGDGEEDQPDEEGVGGGQGRIGRGGGSGTVIGGVFVFFAGYFAANVPQSKVRRIQ